MPVQYFSEEFSRGCPKCDGTGVEWVDVDRLGPCAECNERAREQAEESNADYWEDVRRGLD